MLGGYVTMLEVASCEVFLEMMQHQQVFVCCLNFQRNVVLRKYFLGTVDS